MPRCLSGGPHFNRKANRIMTEKARADIQQALLALADKAGRINPVKVVKAAKQPQHPLHAHFDWDVQRAANAHWLDRARELISSVRVEIATKSGTVSVSYWVRDPDCDPGTPGYRSIQSIREEPEPSRMLLIQEFAQAESHLERARAIAKVVGGSVETEAALKTVVRSRKKIEKSHGASIVP